MKPYDTYDKDNVEENLYKQAQQQEEVKAPEVQAQQAPPQQAPQTDPYAGYQQQMSDNYATTLADIRKRRQEVENRYQPDIERQQKVMKIMALGKLLGAMGQFVGNAAAGGAGKVAVDQDPYMINSWNRLNQTKNEQRYYTNLLDAEERAARQGMQQGLSRLNIERAKASQRMAEMAQKYDLELKKMGANAQLKAAFEQLKYNYNVQLQNAKTAGQLAVVEANMARDAARLARQAANSERADNRKHEQKLDQIAAQGEENRRTKSTPSGGSTVTYVGKGQQKPQGFGQNTRQPQQDNYVQI